MIALHTSIHSLCHSLKLDLNLQRAWVAKPIVAAQHAQTKPNGLCSRSHWWQGCRALQHTSASFSVAPQRSRMRQARAFPDLPSKKSSFAVSIMYSAAVDAHGQSAQLRASMNGSRLARLWPCAQQPKLQIRPCVSSVYRQSRMMYCGHGR